MFSYTDYNGMDKYIIKTKYESECFGVADLVDKIHKRYSGFDFYIPFQIWVLNRGKGCYLGLASLERREVNYWRQYLESERGALLGVEYNRNYSWVDCEVCDNGAGEGNVH